LSKKQLTERFARLLRRVPDELATEDLLDPRAWIWKAQRQRMAAKRDMKIIITSRNGQTGTGKTTLSLWLAMHFDRNGFTADKLTVHPYEYGDLYNEVDVGSVLLMDEGEQLDSRRSMSNKNVDFWNLWMTMRFRQVTSILTLPTASVLDKRGKELADVWINVTKRGQAICHPITIGDYEGDIATPPTELLHFPDVSYLSVKEAADQAKQDMVEGEKYDNGDGEGFTKQDIDKAVRAERDKWIRRTYAKYEDSQRDLVEDEELDLDLSLSTVNKIINAES
jgi:hypothetical protein